MFESNQDFVRFGDDFAVKLDGREHAVRDLSGVPTFLVPAADGPVDIVASGGSAEEEMKR